MKTLRNIAAGLLLFTLVPLHAFGQTSDAHADHVERAHRLAALEYEPRAVPVTMCTFFGITGSHDKIVYAPVPLAEHPFGLTTVTVSYFLPTVE